MKLSLAFGFLVMNCLKCFQASRQPSVEAHVLPGDELILECHYDTSNRKDPTFGGEIVG